MTNRTLTPMSGQDALNELCNYFLGEDFYVVDPLGPEQVNAIIVYTIKANYPGYSHRAESNETETKSLINKVKEILGW